MGHKDIGVHKHDRQLQTSQHWWSSDWAFSDIVRGLENKVYLPPLLLVHRASCTNKG
jgi:hypothetical protein